MAKSSSLLTISLLLLRVAAQFNLYQPMDPVKLASVYNITTDCLSTLNRTLPNCDQTLFQMVGAVDNYWWEDDDMVTLCGSSCSDDAEIWALDVSSACDGQYMSAYGKLIPADAIAGRFVDGLQTACLYSYKNDSWCLVESQNWVGSDIIQPDCTLYLSDRSCSDNVSVIPSENQRMANLYTDDLLCDDCFIQMLYRRVTSPYLADSDHSDYLVNQLQDIGDVCSTLIPNITIRALQTYPPAPPVSRIQFHTTSTASATATATACRGQTISISQKRSPIVHRRIVDVLQTATTCDALSQRYGLTTGDLHTITGTDNCTASGAHCFPLACQLTQVSTGASCDTLAKSIPGNFTTIQFLNWNSNIMGLCDNLTAGQYVCISAPGVKGTYSLAPPPLGTSADAGNQQRGGQGSGATPTSISISSISTTGVTAPGPTQSGIISTCNKFATPTGGIGCYDFATANGVTPAQLYAWNTVLGANGANCGTAFWAKEYYCIGVSGSSSSITTPSPPTTATSSKAAPGPTQTGIISACNKFATPVGGIGCYDFAAANSITLPELYAWNSVLGANGENCGTAFWANEYYCVGISGSK